METKGVPRDVGPASVSSKSSGTCTETIHTSAEMQNSATPRLSGPSSSVSTKYDTGKPRPGLLPSASLLEISKVLAFGAQKYSANNWRNPGFDWSRLMDAAQRHYLSFSDGENLDPESGLPHLAHLGCCVLFLLEHQIKGLGKDDRFIYSPKQVIVVEDIDIRTAIANANKQVKW